MASYKPKKKKRKVKKRIRITQKASIVRKDSVQRDTVRRDTVKSDTIRKAPAKTVLPTNGIIFKVKLRKK